MERRIDGGLPFLWAALALAAMTALAARGSDRASPGDDRDGQALYAKNCLSCHGDSGRGDGPSGLFLKQKPVDLRSGSVRKMSDDELFSRITEGKPPMPGFGNRLSAEDRRALVRYVRELVARDR
ncbi:MAG TPA: cytochrome c [Thermoanaerobaculia bacterium]|nr:cytochrome c [Thermoanaerobaculia bacterium]